MHHVNLPGESVTHILQFGNAEAAPSGGKFRILAGHFSKQRVRAIQIAPRTGAHHERTQHRARLQILLAHRAGQRSLARAHARRIHLLRLQCCWRRSARAMRQTLRSKFQFARRSNQVKPPGSLRRSARFASPHRAVASSDRTRYRSAQNCPPAQTKPAIAGPPKADPFARSAIDISVLDGRTTSAGMRASRAAIASANA